MALLLGWNTLSGGSDLHIPLQGPLSTDLAVLILIPASSQSLLQQTMIGQLTSVQWNRPELLVKRPTGHIFPSPETLIVDYDSIWGQEMTREAGVAFDGNRLARPSCQNPQLCVIRRLWEPLWARGGQPSNPLLPISQGRIHSTLMGIVCLIKSPSIRGTNVKGSVGEGS